MSEVGILTQNLKNYLIQSPGELSSLEGNIVSAAEDKKIKSILVTSCHPSEGKTVSAISMAYSLSTIFNSRVLLVDGHFNAPKIHEFFHLNIEPGLTNLLTSRNVFDEVVRPTEFDNLNVIPCGSKVDNMFDIFKKTFKEQMLSLADVNDYLIFDGYPVLGSTDISATLRYFDGIILVIECEKTRWEIVRMAKEKIEKAGGNILGTVLNRRKFYIPKAIYGKG